MIITANFQKGQNLHTNLSCSAWLVYPNGNSEGSCTVDGRCEPSARERREHVARVLPDETKYTTLRKVRNDSRRVINMFLTVVMVVDILSGEKLHTPLANVDPLRSPSGAAVENEPMKLIGLFIGITTKHNRKGGMTPVRNKNKSCFLSK